MACSGKTNYQAIKTAHDLVKVVGLIRHKHQGADPHSCRAPEAELVNFGQSLQSRAENLRPV